MEGPQQSTGSDFQNFVTFPRLCGTLKKLHPHKLQGVLNQAGRVTPSPLRDSCSTWQRRIAPLPRRTPVLSFNYSIDVPSRILFELDQPTRPATQGQRIRVYSTDLHDSLN
ncbi:hypothetical protein J6590_019268 [Homalodisca vitripennis]|nr:hypothetical protein J6590_019268 [Homalodisca vitripennis]